MCWGLRRTRPNTTRRLASGPPTRSKFEAKKPLDEVFPGACLGRLGSFMLDVQIPPHLVEKVNAIVAELIQEEEGEQAPAKEVTCAACDNLRVLRIRKTFRGVRAARQSAIRAQPSFSKRPSARRTRQDTTAVNIAYLLFRKGS